MSDPTSSHFPDTALSHSDSPPILGRVVATLSDELTADIISKKVRLIKTDQMIQIDKYRFERQTKEQLLQRIPEDVLVSGIVVLPKGLTLKLNSVSDGAHSMPGIQMLDSNTTNAIYQQLA